jgi:hypothetical protein
MRSLVTVDELCAAVAEFTALVTDVRTSMIVLEGRCAAIEKQIVAVIEIRDPGDPPSG